jgi:hypothetical protein
LLQLLESGDEVEIVERNEIVPLELEVKVININEGKNEKIAKRCKVLSEYSVFIAKVRDFENLGDTLEKSIKKAVQYCLKYDILKEFLEENAAEVTNMLLEEWNWEDAIAYARKEEREEVENHIFKLFDQGLSVEEVKRQLHFNENASSKLYNRE